MDLFTAGLTPTALALALAITFLGGILKGLTGFALPLVMAAGFAGFMPHDLVVVAVLVPILVTNFQQALRDGPAAAVEVTRINWRLVTAMAVMLLISTQMLELIPPRLALLVLGLPITAYAGAQLLGLPLSVPLRHPRRAQWGFGGLAGFYGGISGVWGPPLIVYLLSRGTDKRTSVRSQGVFFLLGGVVAVVGHFLAGNLTAPRLAFSVLLTVPAIIGVRIGDRLLDRVNQDQFRRGSQLLLVLTGLNLIRVALS